MHWNHRVMFTDTPIDGGTGVERTYAIHEVFYGDDGNPTSTPDARDLPR